MKLTCPHCGQEIKIDDRTPGDLAVEFYYRSRAAGSNVTLQQVAQTFNVGFEALKKHKQRYDRAGKWGSKKKPEE